MLLSPPINVIIKWPLPNYRNPETRGNSIILVSVAFTTLMVALMLMRLYTRLFITKWFGWDDFLLIVAMVITIPQNAILGIGTTKYGWNLHVWDIPFTHIEGAVKLTYIEELVFPIAAIATIASLLIFYHRLIDGTSIKWFRWFLHGSTAWIVLSFLVFYFLTAFPCIPIRQTWTIENIPGSKCTDAKTITMTGSIVKTIFDVYVTTLPIPLILHMNMRSRDKIGVIILLGLGYVVTAAGAVRTYFTWKSFYGTPTWDVTWYTYPAILAGVVENDLAIICACMPALRPFWLKLFKDSATSFASRFRSSNGTTKNESDLQSTTNRLAYELDDSRTTGNIKTVIEWNSTEV